MDIHSLQAFIKVAETGSFSEGAKALFLTQSAVSKRVSQLEDELGRRLFDRINRQVVLTQAGSVLLPYARGILTQLGDSKRALEQLSNQVSGWLSLATSHHVGLHILPPILRQYTQRYPLVELDLHFLDSESACQAVEDNRIELAVVTLPLQAPPALITTPLWDDTLHIVVAKDHPLAREAFTPEQLSLYPAILPPRTSYTHTVVERALLPLGISLNTRLSSNYLETIKMMVSVGLGWSALPQRMLSDDLQVLSIPQFDAHRQLGVVQHHQRTPTNAGHCLLQLLREFSEHT
ncbi:MAG: LysR family transcriptional regulator [Gammaproteobacteria bacterium]|nr:LysR family transcriptional regulator [Gammaproteobacteria bacterium]